MHAHAQKVISCFLYVGDTRPVLIFSSSDEAADFAKDYPGAKIYHNKTHVFVPKPFGLDLVQGGPKGETAFVFHVHEQAELWMKALMGYGTMYEEGEHHARTVFVGQNGRDYGGRPVWPGLA